MKVGHIRGTGSEKVRNVSAPRSAPRLAPSSKKQKQKIEYLSDPEWKESLQVSNSLAWDDSSSDSSEEE